MNSDINNLLKLRFKKLKPDMDLKQLAVLGLIYSIWSQGIFFKAFYFNPSDLSGNFILNAIRNSCNIAYIATTLGILYENKNSQQNCFKLWGSVKLIDLLFNHASLLNIIVYSRHSGHSVAVIFIFIFILLGAYLMFLMKNIYDQKFPNESGKNEVRNYC